MRFSQWMEATTRSGMFNEGYWVFVCFGEGAFRVYCPNEGQCGVNVRTLRIAKELSARAVTSSPAVLFAFVAEFKNNHWQIIKDKYEAIDIPFRYRKNIIEELKKLQSRVYWTHVIKFVFDKFGLNRPDVLDEYLSDAAAGYQKGKVDKRGYYVINRRGTRMAWELDSKRPVSYETAIGRVEHYNDTTTLVFFKDKDGHFIFTDLERQGMHHLNKLSYPENQKELTDLIIHSDDQYILGDKGQEYIKRVFRGQNQGWYR